MHDGVGNIRRQAGFLNFLLDQGAHGRPEGRHRRVGGFGGASAFDAFRRLRGFLPAGFGSPTAAAVTSGSGGDAIWPRSGSDLTGHGDQQRAG